jgi:hypothetical protein
MREPNKTYELADTIKNWSGPVRHNEDLTDTMRPGQTQWGLVRSLTETCFFSKDTAETQQTQQRHNSGQGAWQELVKRSMRRRWQSLAEAWSDPNRDFGGEPDIRCKQGVRGLI